MVVSIFVGFGGASKNADANENYKMKNYCFLWDSNLKPSHPERWQKTESVYLPTYKFNTSLHRIRILYP